MKNNSTAGAGIYCKLFSSYLSLGTNSTHFDGQLEAINSALKHLFHHFTSFCKAVILSDSKSAIQAIAANNPTSSRVSEIHQTSTDPAEESNLPVDSFSLQHIWQ